MANKSIKLQNSIYKANDKFGTLLIGTMQKVNNSLEGQFTKVLDDIGTEPIVDTGMALQNFLDVLDVSKYKETIEKGSEKGGKEIPVRTKHSLSIGLSDKVPSSKFTTTISGGVPAIVPADPLYRFNEYLKNNAEIHQSDKDWWNNLYSSLADSGTGFLTDKKRVKLQFAGDTPQNYFSDFKDDTGVSKTNWFDGDREHSLFMAPRDAYRLRRIMTDIRGQVYAGKNQTGARDSYADTKPFEDIINKGISDASRGEDGISMYEHLNSEWYKYKEFSEELTKLFGMNTPIQLQSGKVIQVPKNIDAMSKILGVEVAKGEVIFKDAVSVIDQENRGVFNFFEFMEKIGNGAFAGDSAKLKLSLSKAVDLNIQKTSMDDFINGLTDIKKKDYAGVKHEGLGDLALIADNAKQTRMSEFLNNQATKLKELQNKINDDKLMIEKLRIDSESFLKVRDIEAIKANKMPESFTKKMYMT